MNIDMTKAFAASFILHSLLFLSITQQDTSSTTEVSFGSPQKGNPNGLTNREEKIKEKADEAPTKGDIKKNESGFWGIGVSMAAVPNAITDRNGNSYLGLLITEVYPNYPAEINGVRVNDVVYKVDGRSPIGTSNDLRSDGPKPITLEIIRGNQRIVLKFNRDWIRIEGQ